MKKIIFLTILIFTFLGLFLCLNNKKEEIEKKQTVVFWTLQLGGFNEYINNIIEKFEHENPDIIIKWIDVPYSEGEKRTLSAILTDNPPDLVNLTPNFSQLLAQKNALYYIEENKLNQFLPSILNSLKYNDKCYGIPFYATSPITLYNKKLGEQSNIKNMPKTYHELFTLQSKNTYLTMLNFCENDTLLKLLNKYGINTYKNINSKKSTELFNEFKNLYDNNIIPKESTTQTHRDSLEKYMSDKLIFLVTGANFINMIKENAPTVYQNTVILPQLVGETKKYDYSLMNFIIPKKSKNKEAALKFALYFTNKENQLEFAKLTTILPVNKEALESEYFTKPQTNDLISQARIISAKQLKNLQPPISNIKNQKEINTILCNYTQEILINNKDINSNLNKMAKDWQKL